MAEYRLVDVEFDLIKPGDRVIVTPRQGQRFGLLVDHVHHEHWGHRSGRLAVAGYQVRVGEPHHRFTARRVLRRRTAVRALKLQKVVDR